ncbi:serine/threonine-protein kinase Kist-like [Porites lutea]|uniref:serine/threonine-protein kinase Kist-like n=1 Tax=Porites lutea TaxID=51062 RepID=UPI003CC56336
MAKASSSNEFEGQILRSTKYTWKLGRCVGRGTCSVVVEVVGSFVSSTMHRRPQDIKAAVKIFKQAQRFEAAGVNEIEILEYLRRRGELTKCKCRHIAWLIDYFSYKGVMHLVFDRLDCNLHHILLKNSNKGLPLYIVKECARHILEALRFLAANMVIHGDVKMSNIMWNANRGLFQLVDFALSFVKENQPYQPLQSAGYQSPEAGMWNRMIIEGTADRSNSGCCCASDMWSFAFVLWYMYTGTPACRYETDNPVCDNCLKAEEILCLHFKQINTQIPNDGRKITAEQHELFHDLIMKMIKCKPEERITSSNALQHLFLEPSAELLIPSLADMMLLPTTTLLMDNVYLQHADSLKDVEEMCARFGVIRQVTRGSDGKVLIQYFDADECSRAHSALTGWIYNDRTVITCFYLSGKSSIHEIFTPVEPTQQKIHDNGRPNTLGKRSVDSESESSEKDNVKCMKNSNENLDIDLKVKTSF